MQSKAKHKKSSSQKFSLDTKSNQPFKKKLTSPSNIVSKQKSKVSNKRQNVFPSDVNITPSYIIGNCEATNVQETLMAHYFMPSLRSKKGSQITIRGQSKIVKKHMPQNAYNMTRSDYEGLHGAETQRFKSQLKWPSKNHRESMLNTDICYDYGYSQKSNIRNEPSKINKKQPDQSQIQRLLNKYNKPIDKPLIKGNSVEKKQNFRTLSTDDKSQKQFQFCKKQKNRRKKQSSTNKLISITSLQVKHISNNKNKSLKTKRKKNSSNNLLPDYFGCLSINKVESKIQKLKEKEDKSSTKKTKQSMNKTSRGKTHRKSQQSLQMTKIKQYFLNAKEVREFCNKDTKKCISMKYLNNQRNTVLPQRKKSEQKAKVKTQKSSRQTSKKEAKNR